METTAVLGLSFLLFLDSSFYEIMAVTQLEND